MKDLLKDRLVKGYEMGRDLVMVTMDRDELLRMIDLIDREALTAEKRDYDIGYKEGFEYGYQRAIVDVLKKLKGMKWYGGRDYQKGNAAGVPGVPAGTVEAVQQKL